MRSNHFILILLTIGIFSGLASPFFRFTAQAMIVTLAPPLLIAGPTLVTFFASLIAATLTLMLAGIPAAIFERATGRRQTDPVAFSIWIITAAAITFLSLR